MFLIGSCAGFSGDRVDAAIPVVKAIIDSGHPGAIMFETLGERTLALGQVVKQSNPDLGYEPLLEELIQPVIKDCIKNNITIVSNFGAANPKAAAQLIDKIAQQQGLTDIKIAVITGDDIYETINLSELSVWEGDQTIKNSALDVNINNMVSANVYLGAKSIAAAINAGAQIVVAGRVADPALVLGPAMAHYGWDWDDWDKLAQLTVAGHLLECGAQVSGGYFADPDYKDVTDMANIGYPIAEISPDASIVITKPENTGGLVNTQTVKEQILYEIHDPSAYITPDVVLDITSVKITELGKNRVSVAGAHGRPRPDTLKVTVGFKGDCLGEGEISYAGPNCVKRARLAAQILQERLKIRNINVKTRFDLIGLASVFDGLNGDLQFNTDNSCDQIQDIRLRLAVSGENQAIVKKALQEVLALYCTGPAGGGGIRTRVQNRINTVSYLIPREKVKSGFYFV